MRFSVLLAALATSLAFSGPVLADSDLDLCKFVGRSARPIKVSRHATASSRIPK